MINYSIDKNGQVELSINGSLAETVAESVIFVKSVYRSLSNKGTDKIPGELFKYSFLKMLMESLENGFFDGNDNGFSESVKSKDDIKKADFDSNEEFLKFFRGGEEE